MNSITHNPNQLTVVCKNSQTVTIWGHTKHLHDRGLDYQWYSTNCYTSDIADASLRLGYTAKSGGIMLRGANGQCQFRPDEPWESKDGSKPKYRTPDGEYDAFLPWHPTDDNYWDADRLKESCWKINDHPFIVITEGGFKAIAGCSNGIPTVGLLGVTMGLTGKKSDTEDKKYLIPTLRHYVDKGFGFVIAFDADCKTNKNVAYAQRELAKQLLKFKVPVYIATGLWDVEDGKGMDDYIQKNGIQAFRRILTRSVSFEVWEKAFNESKSSIPDAPPASEKNFIQKAIEALYCDVPYVSIAGVLHRWTGTHYEPSEEPLEKKRIADWLDTYAEYVKGKWVHNRATPESLEQVFKWVIRQKAVSLSQVNAGGLNCANGIVEIKNDGSHEFIPHNPDRVYTYVGCKYDVAADSKDMDTLMQCLDTTDREIFLRTITAALCVPLVRMKIGRKLKGLLCHGDGSNGKDTLRTVLSAIIGRGLTGKTLSDFKSYDGGRKFDLAGLESSIVNWASENTDAVKLDALQSLKQAVTGDELYSERKGKDSFPFKSNCVLLFNCNKLPSITGGMEAITSRYSIVKFTKTYKTNPNPSRGELKADPRFKDDPQFVSENLAPALLNMMLGRLPLVLTEGIDHSGAAEAMREAQEESRHLWGFVREISLEERLQGRVITGELWTELREWYLASGWLEIDYVRKPGSSEVKEKEVWQEPPNGWDKPVTNSNQLFARLKELFPKLQSKRTKTERYLTLVKEPEITGKQPSPPSPDAIAVTETTASKGIDAGDGMGDGTVKTGDSIPKKGDSMSEAVTDILQPSPEPSPPSNHYTTSIPADDICAGDGGDGCFEVAHKSEPSLPPEILECLRRHQQEILASESVTTPAAPIQSESTIAYPEVGSKHKNFKKGDRVVVAKHSRSAFEGKHATVTEVTKEKVKYVFDKPVGFIKEDAFYYSDRDTVIMKL